MTFQSAERARMVAQWRAYRPPLPLEPNGYEIAGDRALNLAPCIREAAPAYFAGARISWHKHANHALSSQAACLNFLMPLATRPDRLSGIVGRALGIARPTMLPIEDGPDGEPWFVGFEWIGRADHLGEWRGGTATRGANATSADAVVRFEADGRVETVLIEWKYTESYAAPLSAKGNPTRRTRYADRAFAPDGPVRADLGLSLDDFFHEPFYQLLRQQMLAWRMERAGEDGASRVRVLHIAPAGNAALHRVTAPALRRFGDDAFEAFQAVLVDPDAFVSRTTEQVFGHLRPEEAADAEERAWIEYLRGRYTFIAREDQ